MSDSSDHESDVGVEAVGSKQEMDKVVELVDHHGYNSDDHANSDKFRLFGRQKPVHSALGGGKSADVLLWRNKQVSACLLSAATVIWLLFEWIGYHLLTFLCHTLILTLSVLFLWSNLSFFVNKSPVEFPKVALTEEFCQKLALLFRNRCHQAINKFRQIASGKDLRKFLYTIGILWLVSVVGGWFDFLTLVYIIFVMLLTLPMIYEKHEEQVDAYAEKATKKLKKQYSKLDEKVLQKLPKVSISKDNKQQ